MLTKKQYIAIANIIQSAKEDATCRTSPMRAIQDIQKHLADFFMGDNVYFDVNKFSKACELN